MALRSALQTALGALQRWLVAWMLAMFRKYARTPAHIAFVLDGNRRYADRLHMARRTDGHSAGAAKLEEVLQWCVALNVRVVTVYAFSVENFRRAPEEVAAIMALAMARFEELARNSAFARENRIAVRVLGELDMLPADVRRAAMSAMALTRDHDRHILQVCFPYISRAEILAATRAALGLRFPAGALLSVPGERAHGAPPERLPTEDATDTVRHRAASHAPGGLASPDADPHASSALSFRISKTPCPTALQPEALGTAPGMADALDALMYTAIDETAAAHPPDLIVRTSGESRMSEFLTWQAAAFQPMLAFVPVLWPDFGLRDLVPMLMRYHLRAGYHDSERRRGAPDLGPAFDAVLAERRAAFWDAVAVPEAA